MRGSIAFPTKAPKMSAGSPARLPAQSAQRSTGACRPGKSRELRRPEEHACCNHRSYTNYPTRWHSRVVLGQVPERTRTAAALVSMS